MNNLSPPAPYRLHGRSLSVGRLLYMLMLLFIVSMFALSLTYKFKQGTAACDTVYNESWGEFCYNWFNGFDALGLTAVTFEGYFLVLRIMAALPFFMISLLLVKRRSQEVRVLLFATLLLVIGIAGTWFNPFWEWSNGWFELYGYPELIFLSRLLTYILMAGSLLFVCLFPDGRFVPRWSRWLAVIGLLSLTGDIFWNDTILAWSNWPAPFNTVTPLTFILLGLSVIVIRYRRLATAVQRQQIKWITWGMLLVGLNLLLDFSVFVIYPAITDLYPLTTGRQLVLWELGQDSFSHFSQLILGICFGLAVLKYRLYDIDIIIRRTVQYAAVSVILAAIYYGSVVLLQTIFTSTVAGQSPVVLVISTLVTAALFNPLRTRVQTLIDHRFYRQKYDAEQILANFAQTTRDEVDTDVLQSKLQHMVQETLQPESITIWLKD